MNSAVEQISQAKDIEYLKKSHDRILEEVAHSTRATQELTQELKVIIRDSHKLSNDVEHIDERLRTLEQKDFAAEAKRKYTDIVIRTAIGVITVFVVGVLGTVLLEFSSL